MEQVMYQETKQNPLARQAALDIPSFQGETSPKFDGQKGDLLSPVWGQHSLQGIPTHKDYLPHNSVAWNNSQRQSTFTRKVVVTIGGPQSSAEEMISRIAQRFTYTKGKGVETYLTDYPNVAKTLLAAAPKIEEFFGKGVVVSLRVSCDQESGPILSANIQTALEVSEARAARKSFNTSWWMRQSGTDELPLAFNVEYV